MEQQTIPDFIAIDDNRIDNMIGHKIIQQAVPEACVQTFTNPEIGLEYIQLQYCKTGDKDAVLFLDINMPTLTGWEVLEKFVSFPDAVKKHVKIFILSSSVNPKDKEKADSNPLVTGFIQKPLTKMRIKDILGQA